MKKLTVILTAVFLATGVFAQEKKDTSTIFIGKTKILIISDEDEKIVINDNDTIEVDDFDSIKHNKFNGHWAGVELGLNGYMNSANSMDLVSSEKFMSLNQSKSWAFNLNFAEINIGLVKKYVGITTGLGWQVNNYRFNNNNRLVGDSASLTYFTDTINLKKNKLVASYLTLPIILEFQLPVNQKEDWIHLSFGVVGGLRLGSHTKQVFELNGSETKDKTRDDFHLSNFQYGLTGRLGYNDMSVFVNYSLSSLLKGGEGPELYPWSAGISFSF